MRYYKVLHDFQATDAVELSVRKGDLVCATERIEQDGWIKVELASDTRRRGFIPLTYIRETTNVMGGGGIATPLPPGATAAAAAAPPTSVSFTSAAMSYGNTLQEAYGGRSASHQSRPTASAYQPGGVLSPSTLLANPNSVVEAFMKNEVYFKQLMKQRQEALAKLEGSIAEAVTDIAACKDKNATLARKLRDLDQTIEKERKKWKERVDEEKLLVQRAASAVPTFNAQPASVFRSQVTQQRQVTVTSSTIPRDLK